MDEQESLLAAIHEDVQLHDYDPSWPEVFLLERNRLLSLFPDRLIEIQHIGSTAVPGLLAKPIVDILAGVESMSIAQALAEPLCHSGYTTSAEFNEQLSDRKWFMRCANGHRTEPITSISSSTARSLGPSTYAFAIRFARGLSLQFAMLRSSPLLQRSTQPTGRRTPMQKKHSFSQSRETLEVKFEVQHR